MKFGQVNNPGDIDFTLPSDGAVGQLKKGNGHGTLYLGCSKWTNEGLIGTVFPPETRKNAMLETYSSYFNTVELNATHYRIFPDKTVVGWKDKVADGFKYCPKFPQFISHIKRLDDVELMTDRFIASCALLEDKLGPAFLQLHHTFGPKDIERLHKYLASLPDDFKVYVEVRDEKWFAGKAREELADLLTTLNKGWIITDSSGRRDCVHMNCTLPETMIRFVGNSGHPSDETRMADWAERLSAWRELGLQNAWFFIHQHDDEKIGELAEHLLKALNTIGNIDVDHIHLSSPHGEQSAFDF